MACRDCDLDASKTLSTRHDADIEDLGEARGASFRERVLVSPADAIVAMVHNDMYYTGGTIILDHGHGLTSAMLHMKQIVVKEGERVQQGQKIGTVGQSGRSTGPHLDWRINLFEARLDPAFLVPPMPIKVE